MTEEPVEVGRRVVKMLREAEATARSDRERAIQIYKEAINLARKANLYRSYMPIIRKLRQLLGAGHG